MAFFGVDSGTYTKADADRKRELAKQLMGSTFRAKNPLGALAMALEGGISGSYDKEASTAEAAGNKQIADLLGTKDYAGVMGNEWASPQQSALASMLQGRDWDVSDRNAQWAREDARYAQQRADAQAAASRPEYGFETINGDIIGFDKRNPGAGFQVVFDGPEPTPAPPDLQTLFDEQTGLEYKGAWNPKTQSFDRVGGVKAPSGTSLSVDPATGAVNFTQGAGMKPLTEGQSKDTVYVTRATGALPVLDKYGDELMDFGQKVMGADPTGFVRGRQSPEFQQADQAGTEFLQAILRKDTGAAITPAETAEYGKVYLPQPGDTPQMLAQKKASRQRAVAAIEAGLPPAAILASEAALQGVENPATEGGPDYKSKYGLE